MNLLINPSLWTTFYNYSKIHQFISYHGLLKRTPVSKSTLYLSAAFMSVIFMMWDLNLAFLVHRFRSYKERFIVLKIDSCGPFKIVFTVKSIFIVKTLEFLSRTFLLSL